MFQTQRTYILQNLCIYNIKKINVKIAGNFLLRKHKLKKKIRASFVLFFDTYEKRFSLNRFFLFKNAVH